MCQLIKLLISLTCQPRNQLKNMFVQIQLLENLQKNASMA